MPPNSKDGEILPETLNEDELVKLVAPQADPEWKWQYNNKHNILIAQIYIHLAGLYGLTMLSSAKWTTLLIQYFLYVAGVLGVTMGAHRLWSHKAYKATLPLRILLMLCHSISYQNNVIWWAENHRLHHKYSDTDADPHNATRGFFFSHIGWFFVKQHPEVLRRRQFVDVSDLKEDPVLVFQKKYVFCFNMFVSLISPTMLTWWLGESYSVAWHLNVLRVALIYQSILTINSVAHWIGSRPYDKNIAPVQSMPVSVVTFGEGFHNYHHTFPWDYRVAELGNNWLNISTLMIDLFAKIGWAYDLKTVSPEVINTRAARTGDGTDSWGIKLTEKIM